MTIMLILLAGIFLILACLRLGIEGLTDLNDDRRWHWIDWVEGLAFVVGSVLALLVLARAIFE